MDKVIEININDKYDFIDKYNENNVCTDFINYIIQKAAFVTKKDNIKIVINKKCEIGQNCENMIKDALKEEYKMSMTHHKIIDAKQVVLLIVGIIALILYGLIKEDIVWKEILLIGGWVGIWEMLDLEIFDDARERRKRKILKILLTSNIEVK